MLSETAKKADQIAHINKLDEAVTLLIDMAFGDDTALERLQSLINKAGSNAVPTGPAPAAGAVAAAFTVDAGVAPASNVLPFPTPAKCVCKMAVKDKDSATHICLLCNQNAYENHYVFAHTDEGKALLAHSTTGADVMAHGNYISAEGIEFLPTTEEELDNDGDEAS